MSSLVVSLIASSSSEQEDIINKKTNENKIKSSSIS